MYFIVEGKPKPQIRHKHSFRGTYDPSKKDKKKFLQKVIELAPKPPITAPIRVILIFYMPRPKYMFRTGKFKGMLKPNQPIQHSKTPDIDNLCKYVLDALNGVFYKDDSQISQLKAEKLYCDVDEKARTEVHIEQI